MTLFAVEAAAETPSWMLAHHALSTPDVLVSTKDPSVRQRWVEDAEQARDRTRRLFTLEDRAEDGEVLRRWHVQTTPGAAWWWVKTTTVPPGHRLVLLDPSKPNLTPDDMDEGCDVCVETRPSLAYQAHRKHQEAKS